MRSNAASVCITRVVVDGQQEVELAELQGVMQRIQGALRHIVPPTQQTYIGNALLNLAVCQMLSDSGIQRTASVLLRLVDAVVEHELPVPETAIDLTAQHS